MNSAHASALAILTGCDPSYTLHLEASVVDTAGRPIPDAHIVSLFASEPAQSFTTDATGHGTGLLSAFIDTRPAWGPVLVTRAGYRPFVSFSGRDHVLKPRGRIFITDWDSQLDVTLEVQPSAPGITPQCDAAGQCVVVLPAPMGGHCDAMLVEVGDDAPRIFIPRIHTAAVGAAATELVFEVEPDASQPAPFLVQLCQSSFGPEGTTPSSWAMVTDPLHWQQDH